MRQTVAPSSSRGVGLSSEQALLRPDLLRLEVATLRKALGEGEDQGERMLSDDGGVHLAGVGDDHVTRYELRKHQLVHRRGG